MATIHGRRGFRAHRRWNAGERTSAYYLLSSLLLVQGLGAVFGGYSLVADPSGGTLGMPVEWLRGTPFPDYLIPGLILLFVLGALPLIALIGLWIPPVQAGSLNTRDLSWWGSLITGVALIIWMCVQVLMLGLGHPLQAIFFALGVAIVLTTLTVRLARHDETKA